MYSGGERRFSMANKDGNCGKDDLRLCAIVGRSHVLGTKPNAKTAAVTESGLPQFFSASLTPSQLDATADFSGVTVDFFFTENGDSVLLSILFVSVNFSVVGKRFEDDGDVPPEEVIFLRLKMYSGGGRRSSMVHKDGNNGDDFGGGRRLFMSNKGGSCGEDDARLCAIIGRSHVLGTEPNAKTAALTESNAFDIETTKTPRKFPNVEADESSVFPADFPCEFKLDVGALAKLLSDLPQSYSATLPSPQLDADFFFTAYSDNDVLPPFDALPPAVQCRKFFADLRPLDRILARVVRPGVAVLHVELVCMLSRFRRTLLTFMKGRLKMQAHDSDDSGIEEPDNVQGVVQEGQEGQGVVQEGQGEELVEVGQIDFDIGELAAQVDNVQDDHALLQNQVVNLNNQVVNLNNQVVNLNNHVGALLNLATQQQGQISQLQEALQQLVGPAIGQAAAGSQQQEEKSGKEKPKEGEDEEEAGGITVAEDKEEAEGEKNVPEGEDEEEAEGEKTVAEGEGEDEEEAGGEKTVAEGEDEGTSDGEPKTKHPRLQF